MANIKCKSCGKRYSYHESDLCPHCGAYNKPSSRMRVDFDEEGNAELLHEQEFLRQSAANRQRKDCYEHEVTHESGETTARRGSELSTGRLVGLAVVLVAALIVVVGLIGAIGARTPEVSPDVPIPAEEAAQEITDDYVFYYGPGEQFVLDDQPVWVDSVSLDTEQQLLATVHWEEEPTWTPELYVRYEDGRELYTYTWYEDNMGESSWQYGYSDDGFGWENVAEAYLSFYGYVTQNEMYYETRVDITDALQNVTGE